MSYFFSFSRYQTKCVTEFLFRQLMASWTLRYIFVHPLKQWPTDRKKRKDRNTKNEYLENEKSFLDEIKRIFYGFWRAIIWWKSKNLIKIAGTTSFNNTFQNLLKKYREKVNIGKNYWLRKENIDKINWENLFGRSADHK